MKWSPKGTFALLAGALFTALWDGQRQAPWQRLQGILRTSIQRAAAKVYRTDPFELPAGWEEAVEEALFSAGQAHLLPKSPHPEKQLQEVIAGALGALAGCDPTTAPLEQLSACIVEEMGRTFFESWEGFNLYHCGLSQETLQLLREIKASLDPPIPSPFDGQEVRRR